MSMKLIYLEWQDAFANSGWHSKEEVDEWLKEEPIIKQVGWVYKETKKMIVLVSRLDDFGGDRSFGNLQKIPKTWIKKRVILKI